jgi:hypothetical protein
MTNILKYNYQVLPSTHVGLLHDFSVEPHWRDTDDWTSLCNARSGHNDGTFSSANRAVLQTCVKPWMRCIVEIGVSRDSWFESSSRVLIENKHPDCLYLGIDIEDRSWVTNMGQNVHFTQQSSYNVENIVGIIQQLGHEWIDLLFIDGDHSVNSVLTEWQFTQYVRPSTGVIALHDTNYHPGPWCLMDSLDPSMFKGEKYCETVNDWGFGIIYKL